ncbi:MAG: hypothetical protein AAGM22_26510 [Acidobacteriota bacterium]
MIFPRRRIRLPVAFLALMMISGSLWAEAPGTPRSQEMATARAEDEPADPAIAAKLCKGDTCNECLSAPSCAGEVSGSECRVSTHKGKCVVHKTCLGGACCGCQVGGMVFLGGGAIVGVDGLLYSAEGAVLNDPGLKAKERPLDKQRAVAFRVFDAEGNAVDGAQVRIRATAPSSFTFRRQGATVNGLFQTFVACRGSQPNWPSQILYSYDVISAAGKTFTNSWWQSAGGWTCDTTKDITVRLLPLLN